MARTLGVTLLACVGGLSLLPTAPEAAFTAIRAGILAGYASIFLATVLSAPFCGFAGTATGYAIPGIG